MSYDDYYFPVLVGNPETLIFLPRTTSAVKYVADLDSKGTLFPRFMVLAKYQGETTFVALLYNDGSENLPGLVPLEEHVQELEIIEIHPSTGDLLERKSLAIDRRPVNGGMTIGGISIFRQGGTGPGGLDAAIAARSNHTNPAALAKLVTRTGSHSAARLETVPKGGEVTIAADWVLRTKSKKAISSDPYREALRSGYVATLRFRLEKRLGVERITDVLQRIFIHHLSNVRSTVSQEKRANSSMADRPSYPHPHGDTALRVVPLVAMVKNFRSVIDHFAARTRSSVVSTNTNQTARPDLPTYVPGEFVEHFINHDKLHYRPKLRELRIRTEGWSARARQLVLRNFRSELHDRLMESFALDAELYLQMAPPIVDSMIKKAEDPVHLTLICQNMGVAPFDLIGLGTATLPEMENVVITDWEGKRAGEATKHNLVLSEIVEINPNTDARWSANASAIGHKIDAAFNRDRHSIWKQCLDTLFSNAVQNRPAFEAEDFVICFAVLVNGGTPYEIQAASGQVDCSAIDLDPAFIRAFDGLDRQRSVFGLGPLQALLREIVEDETGSSISEWFAGHLVPLEREVRTYWRLLEIFLDDNTVRAQVSEIITGMIAAGASPADIPDRLSSFGSTGP